jgi:hypothetical protein
LTDSNLLVSYGGSVAPLNAITTASWSTVTVVRNLKTQAISVAALAVGALSLLASGAFAAPPQGRLQATAHLDLRAPLHAVDPGNMAEKSPRAFPSMAHRQNPAPEQIELPLLGSDSMHARPTIQEFVHRVHSEGLPVARLFETKTALLHLGLSPRGKPGLWLVQKTH